MKSLQNRGDTIVEVLIAIAIISVVLVGAYASANHSLNNSRQSQERGEALKIAETQLELIKAFASNPAKKVYSPVPATPAYCFNSSGAPKQFKPPDLNPAYDPFAAAVTLNNDDFSKYAALGCQYQFYNVAIKYKAPTAVGALDDFFTIRVRWDRLGGGRDEISMDYRLHQ